METRASKGQVVGVRRCKWEVEDQISMERRETMDEEILLIIVLHDLEDISQLLTVCDVHCATQEKVDGTELDWYGILQVERFSDQEGSYQEAVQRARSGAEAAFNSS